MIDVNKARALWHELHTFESGRKVDLDQFLASWLSKVETMLGCASCFKKLGWFISRWPVEHGEGFYLWGICLHDFVNKELGREFFYPQITIAHLSRRGIIQ